MKSYSNEEITVSFDPTICIHAAECVKGLPQVFDTTKRPWIDVDQADKDAISEVVMRCPSGALTFDRADGVNEEHPVTEIRKGIDGEIYVKGNIELKHNGETLKFHRAALQSEGDQLFYTESLAKREDKTPYYKD